VSHAIGCAILCDRTITTKSSATHYDWPNSTFVSQ